MDCHLYDSRKAFDSMLENLFFDPNISIIHRVIDLNNYIIEMWYKSTIPNKQKYVASNRNQLPCQESKEIVLNE